MLSSPIRPALPGANRAELAAEALAGRIVSGELRPGARLPEVELAASLGISRNTFREAIKILAGRGLVVLQRHRSAEVARLTEASVRDLYRVRRLVELSAIDAARGFPPDAYHELGAAIAALTRAAETPGPAVIAADLEFHRAIVRLHKSPRIEQSYSACLDELRLGLALIDARASPLAGLLSEHRRIYGLLLSGEHDQCRTALEQHLSASEGELLQAVATDQP
jgi:DNA-binding GntR family transcriptional regulator